jgi:Tfp pilus assembly protein PilE
LAVVAIFAVLASTAYYVRKRRRGAAAPTFIAVSSL